MNNKVTCENHGEANETFVCEHLVGASGANWYSAEPTENDPWPSAWCMKCHESFLQEGEWNEKSENSASLTAKLLCHCCYEETKTKCNVLLVK